MLSVRPSVRLCVCAGYYAQEGSPKKANKQARKQASRQTSEQAGKQASKQARKQTSKQEVGAMPSRGLLDLRLGT